MAPLVSRVQHKPVAGKNGNFELEVCSRSAGSDLSKKLVLKGKILSIGLMWVRPNSCISKKLLWKELCLVEARLCECRPIPVFQRYGLMWVPPNLCVSQKALWKGDIWSRPDYVGSARFLYYKGHFWIGKDVLKPDLCQYRPIRECEGRLFRKETCLETKIMLKTGPF